MKKLYLFISIILISYLISCSAVKMKKSEHLDDLDILAAQKLKISDQSLIDMKEKKLYDFTPKELDKYLGYAQIKYPELPDRVQHFARKSIGQEYILYLLGEFPFELYDTDPLFSIKNSDCLVFTEHMYAMALAKDWPQFFSLLQRIRYKDGEISTVTRNHSTIPQWINSNKWLIRDVTEEIALGLTKNIEFDFDPNSEIKSDYKLNPDFPKEHVKTPYIPLDQMEKVASKLKKGDFVNVIRGYQEPELWAGHVGLITESEDGTINFLDSTTPRVQENPIIEYSKKGIENNTPKIKHNEFVDQVTKDPSILKPERKWLFFKKEPEKPKKKPIFYGFKFYRLEQDPIQNLIKTDGPDAPKVTGPRGLLTNRKDIPYSEIK